MNGVYTSWEHLKNLIAIEGDYLVLDTETTGLTVTAECCSICILTNKGNVLLNTLVKPTRPIPQEASNVHGITDSTVATAPTWGQVRLNVFQILEGHKVVTYNAAYDKRILEQSDSSIGLAPRSWDNACSWYCAMEAYAMRFGQYSSYHRSYRWVKLTEALDALGGQREMAHSAYGDALMTVRLLDLLKGVE